jgi:hypothetical protein
LVSLHRPTRKAKAIGGTFAKPHKPTLKSSFAKELPSQRTKTLQTMDNRATTDRTPAPNSGLAKLAVQYSADTFVVNQNLVLRINICDENRHLRQAAER